MPACVTPGVLLMTKVAMTSGLAVSVTSALTVRVSWRRGARLRARSEISLAMSEGSLWKRFGLPASSKSVACLCSPRRRERVYPSSRVFLASWGACRAT